MLHWMVSSVDENGVLHFHPTSDIVDRDAHLDRCRARGHPTHLEVWDPARHPFEVQWENAA